MSDDVIIVGFPKSGNTWLARLMGDALHRPIRGIGQARPIAAEGEERGDSRGIVQQLHLVPSDEVDEKRYPGFVSSEWTINPKCYDGEHIIHIIRDPRDMAVSIDAYWGIYNLTRTIREVMAKGANPLWGTSWERYLRLWRESDQTYTETRYEMLHADTLREMTRLLALMALEPVNDLAEVVERQSFSERKQQIEHDGDNMTYGKGIQRANLRKGIVGDWRRAFGAAERRAADEVFGDMLIELGYESDHAWAN